MMVELTIPLMLDVIRTTGIIVGIIYYLSILRNQQKSRMIEMATRRSEQSLNYEYQKMVRDLRPMQSGWNTPEEFHKIYNYRDTPELSLSRVVVQNNLNHWGFLFREGIIDEDFIDRLYNPWHIIQFWESFSPIILNTRNEMGNTKLCKDLEYLYEAMKKKYPNISADTRFTYQNWIDE